MLSGYVRQFFFSSPELPGKKNQITAWMYNVHLWVCLEGYMELSISILKNIPCVFFPKWPMRMWDWERKLPMRRGMCAQREGGLGVTTDSALSLKTHPFSHTYTHYLFWISSEQFLFCLDSERKSRDQRLDIENNLWITVGHRGRDPMTPQPILSRTVTHSGMLVASLASLACCMGFHFGSHASLLPGWMGGVLFVRSVSVLLSSFPALMLHSSVNFHRQTEAEGLEVIAVGITAILPLIEQWPHVCRYSALLNKVCMVLPTEMPLLFVKAENGCSNHIKWCRFTQ